MFLFELPLEIVLLIAKTLSQCDARNLLLVYRLSDEDTFRELRKLGMYMPVTILKIPFLYPDCNYSDDEAPRAFLGVIERLDQSGRHRLFLETLAQLLGGAIKKMGHESIVQVFDLISHIDQYRGTCGENCSIFDVNIIYNRVKEALRGNETDEIKNLFVKIEKHLSCLLFGNNDY